MWAACRAFKTIFISDGVPFLGVEGLPIVSGNF